MQLSWDLQDPQPDESPTWAAYVATHQRMSSGGRIST